MSVLEDARIALEKLRALTGVKETSTKNIIIGEKVGVIYGLIANSKIYIGYEFDRNVEKEIKDLLVRSRSYEELGYLYEASYEVLKYNKIKFEKLLEVNVKNKVELASYARDIIIKYGNKCVNIWDPVDILNQVKPEIISKTKNVEKRIKEIETRKKECKDNMVDEYIKEGYSIKDAIEQTNNAYKIIMIEIRKDKDAMYNKKIIV